MTTIRTALALLALAALPAGVALAAGLQWQCALAADDNGPAYCRPVPVEVDVLRFAAATSRPAAPTRRLSRDGDARALAERGDAVVYSADAWQVPLQTTGPATEPAPARLHQLLCGRRAGCEVRLTQAPTRVSSR